MQLGAVALVLFKAVLRVLLRVFEHQAVTRDLRQYRRGGDGHRLRVASHDVLGRDIELGQAVAVDHRVIRLDGQAFYRAPHGVHGGLQDIVALDLFDRAEGDRTGNGGLDDHVEQRVALLFRQLFRVVHALDDTSLGQDDGGSADRSRQGAASGFIDAADMAIALRHRFFFVV